MGVYDDYDNDDIVFTDEALQGECKSINVIEEAFYSAFKKMTSYWPAINQLKYILACRW